MQLFETEVILQRGSVLDADVEGIVNAAKTSMRGGGGLDGMVHRQAGPAMSDELAMLTPFPVNVGSVVVTNGHNLKQSKIFHVPAPMWLGGIANEREGLKLAYVNIFTTAHDLGLKSLGVPSIGTGIYRYPLELAAPRAFYGLGTMLLAHRKTALKRVEFVMFQREEYEAFARMQDRFRKLWEKELVTAADGDAAQQALDVWLDHIDQDYEEATSGFRRAICDSRI